MFQIQTLIKSNVKKKSSFILAFCSCPFGALLLMLPSKASSLFMLIFMLDTVARKAGGATLPLTELRRGTVLTFLP